MSSIVKNLLSTSANGLGIAVAATSSPGTTIHTATAVSNTMDEVYLFANNIDTSPRILTIEFGGTSTSDLRTITLPVGGGDTLVLAGCPLSGGVVIKAYADATNVVNIIGYVNTITQP